ncbi:TPA: morphogenetic protein [Salmonella enterica]|uniref:Morphogenetic protein n=1 Tax=Salmonella enterica TaxID=28901 RepID=A0A763SR15_SALER|nr:morphogenetic protein [Salmonella enterica]HAG4525525.1 morphogenetic protein [Salmonella enterica]
MKERGMIFNGEMVRAILDGRKTQTRRIVSERHLNLIDLGSQIGECYPLECGIDHANSQSYYREHCPFGKPGDRIWVRETYQGPLFDYEHMESYLEDSSKFEKPDFCVYRADGKPAPEFYDADDNLHCGWRPSIHMPRWASRLLLEIASVRVERLRSMSQDDARAEGVIAASGPMEAGLAFRELWESIYGEESWKANPWVWVIEFKRIESGEA